MAFSRRRGFPGRSAPAAGRRPPAGGEVDVAGPARAGAGRGGGAHLLALTGTAPRARRRRRLPAPPRPRVRARRGPRHWGPRRIGRPGQRRRRRPPPPRPRVRARPGPAPPRDDRPRRSDGAQGRRVAWARPTPTGAAGAGGRGGDPEDLAVGQPEEDRVVAGHHPQGAGPGLQLGRRLEPGHLLRECLLAALQRGGGLLQLVDHERALRGPGVEQQQHEQPDTEHRQDESGERPASEPGPVGCDQAQPHGHARGPLLVAGRDGVDAQGAAAAHAASLTLSAARSRADAALGFAAISSASGTSAPRVSNRSCGAASSGTNGRSSGTELRAPAASVPLHQPVLEGLVGQHDDAPADRQRGDRCPAARAAARPARR